MSGVEPSADRHAAEVIREIGRVCPEASFFGVAGPRMRAAGCEVIEDWTRQAAMLVGAVRLAGRAWRLIRRVRRELRERAADLAILVDSPALHLPMARQVRAAGCPVMYYIAPQLWAWAPWRIGRVRRRVDRLAAILPFEEGYFRQRGVDARFVGHPLVEQVYARPADAEAVAAYRAMGEPVVACLPGSRDHVVREVLPGQIEVARAIAARFPRAVFLFSAASEAAAALIREAVRGEAFRQAVLGPAPSPGDSGGGPDMRAALRADPPGEAVAARDVEDVNAAMLGAADLALCASGTATLEVALRGVPMVVMYNGSKWGYRLVGRWLIRTPHLSLVNILAGRRVVPEFMPYYTATAPIAAEAIDLLTNEHRRATIRAELEAVARSLGERGAAAGAAAMAMDMIQSGSRPRSSSS